MATTSNWTAWTSESTDPDPGGSLSASAFTGWVEVSTAATPTNEWYVASSSAWVAAELYSLS